MSRVCLRGLEIRWLFGLPDEVVGGIPAQSVRVLYDMLSGVPYVLRFMTWFI